MKTIKEKLALLPDKPGVYLMKNEEGSILYVGKAKILKNRVRSYFSGSHDLKTQKLVSQIADFEYIVTSSEAEAFILEFNLIKSHTPPYNIMLKDDKSYPYLLITDEKHPRILITRNVQKKSGRFFGPFPNAGAAREAAQLLNRLLPLRKCRTLPDKPCLYYHIQQCLGPCIHTIEPGQYRELLKKAQLFLQGDQKEILCWLEKKMLAAAEELQFEAAKEYRDLIVDLKKLKEKQNISLPDFRDRDIVAYVCDEDWLSVQIFYYRQGKLIHRNAFLLPYYGTAEEAFFSFLMQYYHDNTALPPEICLAPLDCGPLADLLPVSMPRRGAIADLLRLARTNAQSALNEKLILEKNKTQTLPAVLETLGHKLRIPYPAMIEAFDISGLSGTHVVGGMIRFFNGLPQRSAYRKFNLTPGPGLLDDTGYLREVVTRRYSRLLRENSPLPQLILVDGGKGQIKAALNALENLGLAIPVAGLVKNDRHETRGLLDAQGEEISLDGEKELFRFLAQMQEEVHRFAITFHRQQRIKHMTDSRLDQIPGIGPKRRRLLLQFFDSPEKIREASLQELQKAGLPASAARQVHAHFHPAQNSTNSAI